MEGRSSEGKKQDFGLTKRTALFVEYPLGANCGRNTSNYCLFGA